MGNVAWSLVQMLAAFPTEAACIKHLESTRWKNGAFCPYCGNKTVYHFKDGVNHKCADCRQRFSIKVGSIFEDSKIPLKKWFMAVYLITAHKKGISSLQLAKDIDVTQKTAWFMVHRLRHATKTQAFNAPLPGPVEIDETYIGGKEKNKHQNKRTPHTQGSGGVRAGTKQPVLAIVQRQGHVHAFPIPNAARATLKPLIVDHVTLGARIYTDEHSGYDGLNPFWRHAAVNHGQGEYVRGDAYTNSAEGFFSLLKRGIIGIYHQVSFKHLHRYLNEFAFRYNLRFEPNGQPFAQLLDNCGGRLTYKALIAA